MDPRFQEVMAYPVPDEAWFDPGFDRESGASRRLPLPPEPSAPPNAGVDEPAVLDVVAIIDLFQQRKLSPVELLDAYLERIDRLEPRVRAWVTFDADRARAEARRAEQWWLKGGSHRERPLAGVPVGIKDIIFTADFPTTAGSRLYENFRPSRDAAVVAALRRAGAIILGKTTTTEFAYGDPPPTRNPWHLEHTPGGSSAGSGAALAARMVPLALGTQTVASTIRPSAYCGVAGLVPTQALISRDGVIPLSPRLDHVGPMATSVRDLRYVLPVLAAADGQVPSMPVTSPPGIAGLKVGIPDRHFNQGVDPEVERAYAEALDCLRALGAELRPVTLPPLFDLADTLRSVIVNAEAAAYHDRHLAEQGHLLGAELKSKLAAGSATPAPVYVKALQLRASYMAQMQELLKQVDVLATPATPTPAPAGITWTGHRHFSGPFTLGDLPSLTFPIGRSQDGLPIGMQLVAAPYGETVLLAVGEAYQEHTAWHREYPR